MFYHVWCSNHWREVVEEHTRLLIDTGLGEEKIHIGVIGTEEDVVELSRITLQLRQSSGITRQLNATITHHGEDPLQFEYPTLEMLRAYSAVNEGAVCYFHTKGVSVLRNDLHDWWRGVMNEGVLRGWRDCVAALKSGSDVAGCKFTHSEHGDLPYFAGNFWWAKCSHIRTLPPFARPHRYEAERWVCGNNPVEFHIPVSRPL